MLKKKSKKKNSVTFTRASLEADIVKQGKILRLSKPVVKEYAEIISAKVTTWAEKKKDLTQSDLDARLAKELAHFNSDLSFVYKNRGKII